MNQTRPAVFRLKLHITRRKSATKFLCVNTVSDKVVKPIYPCKKMIRGGRPLLRENLAETDQSPSKTPISNQHLLVAPQP